MHLFSFPAFLNAYIYSVFSIKIVLDLILFKNYESVECQNTEQTHHRGTENTENVFKSRPLCPLW